MTTSSTTLTALSGDSGGNGRFTLTDPARFLPFLATTLLITACFVFPAQSRADDSHRDIKSRLSHEDIRDIKRRASFELTRRINFSTDTNTINFLLNHLDLTCAIIRGWNLEQFVAEEIEPGFYRASDAAGLKGYILQLNESDTNIEFSGLGQFESANLPITLRGKALSQISVKPVDGGVRVKGALQIRVSNPFIHVMSQIFYPIVATVADNKADHLVKIGKKTIRKISQSPDKTSRRLDAIDSHHKEVWIQYLRTHSSSD